MDELTREELEIEIQRLKYNIDCLLDDKRELSEELDYIQGRLNDIEHGLQDIITTAKGIL